MEDFERELKVLVVGNSGVGKSSMIQRFCSGTFSEDARRTVGVDFLEKLLPVPALGEDVRLFVWDTAGQVGFDALSRSYCRGAGAAAIVFSSTDRASFDAVPAWRRRVVAECGDVALALVQSKVDLLDRAVVSSEEAEEMARRLGLKFYRSCAKEGLNVTEVFQYLVELHASKAAAGQLRLGPASQPLEPAGGGGGGRAGGEAFAVVELKGHSPEPGKGGGKGAGGDEGLGAAEGPAPSAAGLQPSKRRGQKTLGQRMKQLFK
ncbi:hypothetical protein Rsub_04613 [Raphidocelis subcapitata]|uniref:Ras-related protein Rab-23 n=1 Tax=Raphidocelis subcapitata TaxID=307507 RepID=A0A2V0NYW5_9CHLO|nr:hypothetical protein Rsub_04613 [Raphidocelis subcapitata]|eukprot:GBF92509.1 hypothetical protein Rsub_04613 [Raphidocelis subcapitata]